MAHCRREGSRLVLETDRLQAVVETEGYVSGVAAGSFYDKATGATDLGFGLHIVDFLLEPLADEPDAAGPRYHTGDLFHGQIPKRYVELPQICTQAGRLAYAVEQHGPAVVVRLWYRWTEATYGRRPGSLWEQTLVFRDGWRYFLSADRVTSANDVEALVLRLDMPGHLKHQQGDSFCRIYLSYYGEIPACEFYEDFPPDARFLYRRQDRRVPAYMIRGYQVRGPKPEGPWLAGITLAPEVVWEAWCHQRGYVCFIQEIGGWPVRAGERLEAAYAVGWFDNVAQMEEIADQYRGWRALDEEAIARAIDE